MNMNLFITSLIAIFASLVSAFHDVPTVPTPVYTPRCRELADAYQTFQQAAMKNIPDIFESFIYGIAVHWAIDINDTQLVGNLLCNAAHAKTVKDVFPPEWMKYVPRDRQFPQAYPSLQRFVADLGGYTNLRRIIGVEKDFIDWRRGLGIRDAKALRNVTDVEGVQKFLVKMNVKYGSRWLSIHNNNPEHSIVLNDTAKMAEDLYESNSRSEFAQRTGLPFGSARSIWFKFYLSYIELTDVIEPAVKFFEMVGDYGLFNIPLE